jgi:hypothetical protein
MPKTKNGLSLRSRSINVSSFSSRKATYRFLVDWFFLITFALAWFCKFRAIFPASLTDLLFSYFFFSSSSCFFKTVFLFRNYYILFFALFKTSYYNGNKKGIISSIFICLNGLFSLFIIFLASII